MLKHLILVTTLLVSGTLSIAQRLEPFTINSGGGGAQVQDMVITFAIGEGAVGDFVGIIPSMFLPFEPDVTENRTITLYPNPVKEVLFSNSNEELTFHIYSMQNALLISAYGTSVSVEHLSSGSYYVIVKDQRGKILTAEFIVKI